MTSSLYKQIFKNNSYREKVKNVIDFDDAVDHLISKEIISETDYLRIWNSEGSNLDLLFEILNSKRNNTLVECFTVFKSLYGEEFEVLLQEIKQDILDYVHLKGGFPKINKYIPRIAEEKKIKEKFANIRWDNSLVVYGRVGEGKSYLVSESLKDEELISTYFDNRLFWINVGECENGSNVLQPLTRLLRMISPRKGKVYDLDDILEELCKLFSSEKYRKSLVILDNARSFEVIEIFQRVRCKLLIITHYKTVKYAEFVEIDSGFSLNETITLFAEYLGTNTENLNNLFFDDIKDIHELCKGHPSTLALLGVILSCKKEHALACRDLWNDIKEKIDKGEIEDLGNDDVDIIRRNFHEALRMCIDTIKTEDMKELYHQFAVFPKDANISTEVLEVFWGKKAQEVWHIMLHFENRSLVNSFYNIKKKVYIYVIHDLFLYYLKNETKARKKEFHKKLITSYENLYEFHDLPDDNYILLFLGYHLKQAEMTDKFEKFLDLKFIDHKIRIVGVNNMEQDLKMYRTEIINGNAGRKKKLDNCLKFIKDNKNELRQLQKTDIVQLALPTLKDDAQTLMVTNEANSINKLYFTIKLSAGRLKSSQELFMKEDVTAMAFCTDSNVSKILIGLANGDVLLFCSQTNKEFDRFHGHKDLVFDLKVSHDNSSFLSVSKDQTVKLWQFFSQRLSFGLNDVPTSPKNVQNEYVDAFCSERRNSFKDFTYNEDGTYLICANFSNKYRETRMICTGTNNGKIILWNVYTKEKLFTTTETGFPVENIYFSQIDSKILFTKQDKIQIFKYEHEELSYLESIVNLEDVVKLFVPNEKTLISVGMRYVMMYKLPYEDDSGRIKVYESKDYNITCSAIAKGEYFAVGIREKVLIFAVANGVLVETLKHNKIVTSISMDVSKDDDNITSMILMNFDNNIQQCNIMMQHYGQPRNKQGLVTTYWKNKNLPMLALVLNENILKIQHEFNTINEVVKSHRITFITFSLCGNNIIFSLENGKIIEFQYKRQGCFKILMKLKNPVKYLQCFEMNLPTDNSITERSYNSSDSENGAIVVVTDGDKKIHILLDSACQKNFSWDFPIFHVFPMASQQLLCIDESAGVFIINISKGNGSINLINYATLYRKVSSAAFCSKNNLVAITFTKQDHGTNCLEVINVTSKQTLRSAYLDFIPECCTFSYLGGLLAVGGKNGEIMVFNMDNHFKRHVLNNAGPPLKFIQFSKSALPILVAVGREVSWWNLCKFETNYTNLNFSQCNGEFDIKFWENKTIHTEIPYLLQTVSLYSNVVHFSVSRNFETFLIVDDESRIYVLKCFKNSQ